MPPKGDAKKPAGGVRGVSAEEKSRRMLEIFKSAEVYSLKELEKLGVKKGVLSQSIPDIVKGLVDDGLVDMDKIGGGNFYWALPSKQGQRKKARLDQLKADLSSAQDVAAREHARVGQLEEERQAPERATQLKRWDELKLLHVELKEKLKHYEDRDPTVLKALGEKVNFAIEHACRWGLNLSSVREYVQAETGLDAETFDGRYDVCSMDMEPITWANYKSFLPSETAPLVRKSLDDEFCLEIGDQAAPPSAGKGKGPAEDSAPTPTTVARAPVALGFRAAKGAPAMNSAAKAASTSSAPPKGGKEKQHPQGAAAAAAPKKAAKKSVPKKAAAAEKKGVAEGTEREDGAKNETSAADAVVPGQGAGKGKTAQKVREKKPAEKKDKNAAKKKPVEKKDKGTRPAVCAADDDDDDFADDAPAAKKATR